MQPLLGLEVPRRLGHPSRALDMPTEMLAVDSDGLEAENRALKDQVRPAPEASPRPWSRPSF